MTRLLSLTIAVLLAVMLVSAARTPDKFSSDGRVMYIYRNDSIRLTSFDYDRVVRMECTRTDTTGSEHTEYVTQMIETLDTVYAIPMAVIDSIAFHPLPTKYQPKVRIIDQTLLTYLSDIDNYDISFEKSIPADLLPHVEDVLFAWPDEGILNGGFAGRVTSIERQSNKIVLHCNEVQIYDVFEQLFACFDEDEGNDQIAPRVKYDPIPIHLHGFGGGLDFNGNVEKGKRYDILKSFNIGVNNIEGWLYPHKVEVHPKLTFCLPEFFKYEIDIDCRSTLQLDFDLCLAAGPKFVLPILDVVDYAKNSDYKKLRDFANMFSCLPCDIVANINAGAALTADLVLGYSTEMSLNAIGRIDINMLDFILYCKALNPLDPDVFSKTAAAVKLITTASKLLDKCSIDEYHLKYAFFSGTAGVSGGCELMIGSKLRSDNTRLWKFGAGLNIGAMAEFNVPFYLNENTLRDRDTSVHEALLSRPAFGLSTYDALQPASMEFQFMKPDEVTTDLFLDDYRTGIRFTLSNTPHFDNPLFDPINKTIKYDISSSYIDGATQTIGKQLYPHSVGVVLYDEWAHTQEEYYFNDAMYYNGGIVDLWNDYTADFDDYEIELKALKPNREYTVYPIVDQLIGYRNSDPIPLLASPSKKLKIECSVNTLNFSLDSRNMTAELSGRIGSFSTLKSIHYETGIQYGPADADSLTWTSIKGTPDEDGLYKITTLKLPYDTEIIYRAYLKIDNQITYGNKRSFTTPQNPFVDLGLSVKWASKNLGAESSTDYGDYYSWGELTSSNTFSWATYIDNPYDEMDNWIGCSLITGDICGGTADVASMVLGNGARMPSRNEMQELINKCKWEWTKVDNVNGYKVTGPSGAHIFLPAGGLIDGSEVSNAGTYGGYWSGSISPNSTSMAGILYFYGATMHALQNSNRYIGRSIRAVHE